MPNNREDQARLERAIRLTDALDDPAVLDAAAASIQAGVNETARLNTVGQGDDAMMPRPLCILAGIGLAFRRIESPHDEAPLQDPGGLFQWGGLRVLRRLGEGRFGEVYAAWDPSLRREVAIKLRRPEAGTLRWLDEARSLARVQHPNVVTIYGADLAHQRAGLWMELVNGETLEARLARAPTLTVNQILHLGRDLASALEAVHRAALVHGDVKPSNVMLGSGDPPAGALDSVMPRVVLMDFGAASMQSVADRDGLGPRFGTPLALAPEVLSGSAATPASDVYALGVLLYRAITGRFPIEGNSIEALRAAHREGRRVPLARTHPAVPRAMARSIDSALAPDPRARPTAAALRDNLSRQLGERVARIAPRVLMSVVAIAAVAVAAMWALWSEIEMRNESRVTRPPAPRLAIAADPIWTTRSDARHHDLGWNVALADHDGDGFADLIVTDPGYGDSLVDLGMVGWVPGSPSGLASASGWAVLGRTAGDRVGWGVGTGGDFNGDGRPDLVVSDCIRRPGRERAFGNIRIYGTSSSGLDTIPLVTLSGELQLAGFNTSALPVGDLDGDGFADLIVTEQNWNGEHRNQGRVRIFRGRVGGPRDSASWILIGDPQSSAFGSAAAGVGDLNGDGFDDLLVGAGWWKHKRAEVGAVHVFFGSPSGPIPAPRHRIAGRRGGDLVGYSRSIAALGDINGDGRADAALGVIGHDGRGRDVGEVRVYAGTAAGLSERPVWRSAGFGSGCQFGVSVAGRGDADGDGQDDLLVGAYGYGTSANKAGAGALFLYRGRGAGQWYESSPAWWTTPDQSEALFGSSVAMADFNGDGRAEVVAGSPRWRDGPVQMGRIWVYGVRDSARP